MWQDLLVYAIMAAAGGAVCWRAWRKLTGKNPGCGGCSCSGSCPSGGDRLSCGKEEGGLKLAPLSGSPCKHN